MSSVQRFIRQIQPHGQFYKASDIVTAAAAGLVYELVPDANNVVGNYPPGTMTASTAGTGALAAGIAQANNAASSNVIVRDMGKTVKAALTLAPTGAQYFFRQVQLISLASAPGVQGGVNTPTNNSDYLTFYVPISILGAPSASVPLLGGACQM
jgi:hypothetical protein